MNNFLSKIFFIFSLMCCAINANGSDFNNGSFAAIKERPGLFRSGPNIDYPVSFQIDREHAPLLIINSIENWRYVQDADGQIGWIHTGNLIAKRTVLTRCASPVILYSQPNFNALVVSSIEDNMLFSVIACTEHWCHLSRGEMNGWIEKKFLWGATYTN